MWMQALPLGGGDSTNFFVSLLDDVDRRLVICKSETIVPEDICALVHDRAHLFWTCACIMDFTTHMEVFRQNALDLPSILTVAGLCEFALRFGAPPSV